MKQAFEGAARSVIAGRELVSYEELEAFYEEIDPLHRIVPYAFGCYAQFRPKDKSRSIRAMFEFYIRVAPPRAEGSSIPEECQFRKVRIQAIILNEREARFKVSVFDMNGRCIADEEGTGTLQPFGGSYEAWLEVPCPNFSKVLGHKPTIFSSPEMQAALSTPDKVDGRSFFFFPSKTPSHSQKVTYSFAVRVGIRQPCEGQIQAYALLYHCGGFVTENGKIVGSIDSRKCRFMIPDTSDEGIRDRWSVEYLLELSGELAWKGYEKQWSWGDDFQPGLRGLLPINCLAIEDKQEQGECIVLRDWHIDRELVPRIKAVGEDPTVTIERIAAQCGYRMAGNAVAQAFKACFERVKSLYTYQAHSLELGLKAEKGRCIILVARSAGGKTIAFMLPLLIRIVDEKIREIGRVGCKALLFYPTIPLCHDQAETILKLVWRINQVLKKQNKGIISLGILHGETRDRRELSKLYDDGINREELRIKCPECGERRLTLIISKRRPEDGWASERIECSSPNCKVNKDPELNRLLNETLRATRDAIYADPPDILITNPDMMNVRLTYEPESQSIIGRELKVCKLCGFTTTSPTDDTCIRCEAQLTQLCGLSHPEIIVIDEAHLLRGAFGAHVSHVLTRLEEAIRRLNRLNSDWRPLYFIASATLNNPRKRAKELLTAQNLKFDCVEADYEPELESAPYVKYHVFIMPKAYAPSAAAMRTIHAILDYIQTREISELPSTLLFVNKIAEANHLVHLLRDIFPDHADKIDGHTTDYKRQRADVEDRFSRGEVCVLIATPGLEVGVDFDRITIGGIFGMPYHISAYTQRIGRVGRTRDSVVLNILIPDRPVDHFFFRNWRLLCDVRLREQAIRWEAYRIKRENPEVVKRAVQRALFDYLSTMPNAHAIYHEPIAGAIGVRARYQRVAPLLRALLSGQALSNYLQALGGATGPQPLTTVLQATDLNHALIEYVERAIMISPLPQFALDALVEAVEAILDDIISPPGASSYSLRKLIYEYYKDRFLLWNVRSTELRVEYVFNIPWLPPDTRTRERELSYAFRHAHQGQIVGFRAIYTAVKDLRSRGGLPADLDPVRLIWR